MSRTPAISTVPTEATGEYELDPAHTCIEFVARHAMVTRVRGAFTRFEGSAHLDVKDPSKSRISAVIDVASVETRNRQRDDHLRTSDFFDIATYPSIAFTSTSVAQVTGSVYRLEGDLTIKDVTKPISINFEFSGLRVDPFGNTRIGFQGSTVVNRKDWGLVWNMPMIGGGLLVSERVVLEFNVSAIKRPPH